MNAPQKKITPNVGDALSELDKLNEQRTTNLRIWDTLGKTDPAHTKQFSRAGGFKGTAIKPIWITKRLTEQFGPCGEGWGIGEPKFQVETTLGGETLVYCTVSCWHGSLENRLFGVGGDKVVAHRRDGTVFCDDEAFKKAFTDAVGNAFKFIGVGADVHMGLFEDSKYLAEVKAEFNPKPDEPTNGRKEKLEAHKDDPFPLGPAKNKTELKTLGRTFWRDVESAGDGDTLAILLADKDNVKLVNQIMKGLPSWWDGGHDANGEAFEGLEAVIARKRRDFAQIETVNGR